MSSAPAASSREWTHRKHQARMSSTSASSGPVRTSWQVYSQTSLTSIPFWCSHLISEDQCHSLPKKSKTACLNFNCSVALTSTIMEFFEQFGMAHINSRQPSSTAVRRPTQQVQASHYLLGPTLIAGTSGQQGHLHQTLFNCSSTFNIIIQPNPSPNSIDDRQKWPVLI